MYTFLIVDDDPMTTDIVSQIVRDFGAEAVVSAADGRAALDRIAERPDCFDVLLCDLNMPGMDGVELIRNLAAIANPPRAVILMSCSDPGLLRAVSGLAAGRRLSVAGVLTKPVRRTDLLDLLFRLPARPGAAAPPAAACPSCMSQQEITAALAAGRVVPWFQPKVRTHDRAVVGYEALARIRDVDGSIRTPASFIPSITDSALAYDFTMAIARETARWMSLWRRSGLHTVVSMNVWPSTLDDLRFCDDLSSVFHRSGVSADAVILEVTETEVAKNAEDMMDTLARLCLRGFQLSIDDFGIGYSTMEKLRSFPVSELKIDQSFVRNAGSDPVARSIVQSSAALGRSIGIRSVAEGVEDAAAFALVAAHGVDIVQGYLISRPMPPDEVMAFHGAWSPAAAGADP